VSEEKAEAIIISKLPYHFIQNKSKCIPLKNTKRTITSASISSLLKTVGKEHIE